MMKQIIKKRHMNRPVNKQFIDVGKEDIVEKVENFICINITENLGILIDS